MSNLPPTPEAPRITEAQEDALTALCGRYGVEYDAAHYWPAFDLPEGWQAGWVGGPDNAEDTIYVGCSPDGEISS